MKKFNLRSIMKKAWAFVKKFGFTMAQALRTAWANAKAIIAANVTGMECHTWSGWKDLGKEVIHESVALFKVTVIDPSTKKGTRILSYFGENQVCPLGSQD